jgi:hypothetical protein
VARVDSERVQAKWCSAGACQCNAGQGEGGIVLASRCRAGVRGERGWNVMHTLRALGGSDASKQRGRGGVHGRSRAGLAWGIDPWARCEAGGEVMAREVVGCTLTKHGVHRQRWRRPRRRRGGDGGSLLRGVGVGF